MNNDDTSRKVLKKEARAALYALNKDYFSTYYRDNYTRLLLHRAKARAKKLGVSFNLTEEDVSIPKFCPVLGVELQVGQGKQGPKYNSPSLDRIDNTLGYVKGNVAIISGRANLLKKDGTPEELRKVADWVEANQF